MSELDDDLSFAEAIADDRVDIPEPCEEHGKVDCEVCEEGE